MRRILFFAASHLAALAVGFALGVYFLPILTAPSSPDAALLDDMAQEAQFSGEFRRGQRGNDFLHWGEGEVSLTPTQIVHRGNLAPGPDYKLYLVPQFVEHEDEFLPIKESARQIGDIKTFGGFVIDIPADVDPAQYNTVLIWCEAFAEFITSAQYR